MLHGSCSLLIVFRKICMTRQKVGFIAYLFIIIVFKSFQLVAMRSCIRPNGSSSPSKKKVSLLDQMAGLSVTDRGAAQAPGRPGLVEAKKPVEIHIVIAAGKKDKHDEILQQYGDRVFRNKAQVFKHHLIAEAIAYMLECREDSPDHAEALTPERIVSYLHDNKIDVAAKLISAGSALHTTNIHQVIVLASGLLAPRQEDLVDLVKVLILAGAKIDALDSNGNSPLHVAALLMLSVGSDAYIRANIIAVVRTCIEFGKANVNELNGLKQTPLHCAVTAEFSEMLALLLEKSAEPNMIDETDCTPLMLAYKYLVLTEVTPLMLGQAENNARILKRQETLEHSIVLLKKAGGKISSDTIDELCSMGYLRDHIEVGYKSFLRQYMPTA